MEFKELKPFQKRLEELDARECFEKLKQELSTNPAKGDVIPGMDGLRKVRMGLPNRGKSGGARVLYLYLPKIHTILFLVVYSKGETEDLPPDERKTVRQIVNIMKKEHESW